jgi:hypothetical protein
VRTGEGFERSCVCENALLEAFESCKYCHSPEIPANIWNIVGAALIPAYGSLERPISQEISGMQQSTLV